MTKANRMKGAFGVVSSVTSTTSAVTSLRKARQDKDKLLYANAFSSMLVAITSVLIAVRALRRSK
ncbi:MAG: hypothetical protein M3548_04170 [Actinomycetota bacterium]|nr:hypothetical protein [Actinomycetota bacterium]